MNDFFNMPWCEYIIKRLAYYRMDRNKWEHTRLIAFESKVGSHLNPAKLPKTLNEYINLDGTNAGRKRASKENLEQLKKERDEFYGNNNG